MRVAAYVRPSTVEQADFGVGPDAQRAAVESEAGHPYRVDRCCGDPIVPERLPDAMQQ